MPSASPESDRPPAAQPSYRYWAFLSYSHRDTTWATRLHERLETWRVPAKLVGRETAVGKLPARLYPVFRDRDELAGGSLDEVIQAALKTSRYLIVLCSPHSAASKYVNEEIRLFKALGRADRIVYLIVAGEPGGDPSGDPKKGECFPPWARSQLAADGQSQGEPVEPIAADARPGKDGWPDALLKVCATLLGVPFDELKLRDRHRRRRALALNLLLGAAACLLLVLAYIAAADAGLNGPAADRIRSSLDAREASLFRPVKPAAEIVAFGRKLESDLTTAMRKRRQADGWYIDSIPTEAPRVSIMSHAQALASVAAPGPPTSRAPADFAQMLESEALLFKPGLRIEMGGVRLGWKESTGPVPFSFIPLWTAIALGEMLGDPRIKADPAAFRTVSEHLQYTQEALQIFHPDPAPGAWNVFPWQIDPDQHSVYASALALMALAEAAHAQVPWEGSTARRDELLRQTAAWLLRQYHTEGTRHGWLNNFAEEHVNNVFDGLTAKTYGALLAAEAVDPQVVLSEEMHHEIARYLVGCVTRTIEYPIDAGDFRIPYRLPDGTTGSGSDALRYLWWPWVIRTADLWLRSAEAHHCPRGDRTQVRRTLAHLVNDLGPQEVANATSGYAYTVSESLFCLRKFLQDR